jgi:hypothetical protein
MPFAARHRSDPTPRLEPMPNLSVYRVEEVALMAALQRRPEDEISRRFDAGHRACVAMCDGHSAAWGWVATRSAEIGEVGA